MDEEGAERIRSTLGDRRMGRGVIGAEIFQVKIEKGELKFSCCPRSLQLSIDFLFLTYSTSYW